jgi:phosphomannomutase
LDKTEDLSMELAVPAQGGAGSADVAPTAIKFGTDGWRAIIGADFNTVDLARVAAAAARVYRQDNPLADVTDAPVATAGSVPASASSGASAANAALIPNTLIVGYDCRQDAGRYAALVGEVLAQHGFDVLVSQSYCPTPALCWSVAQNPAAVGGLMLTSSHNPAEYLGVKLRMADGGASPQEFSGRVEAELIDGPPAGYPQALAVAQAATNGTPQTCALPLSAANFAYVDLMTPYLDDLLLQVDAKAIASAGLRVVVDPLYGAGRLYLAQCLRQLGVQVVEVNAAADPSFGGLHPEPILPWIQTGLDKTHELGFDACFITDGDADRIGAGSSTGDFVNPHKILALVCEHLFTDKGRRGRVVRTLSGSNLIKRQCQRLGLELTTTPIGFKWIYEQMLAGDVLVGGEESGGIGIPNHVRERDGLLIALLLTELMAQKGQGLGELVARLMQTLGPLEYDRRDLQLDATQKQRFLTEVVERQLDAAAYQQHFANLGEHIDSLDYRDGIKFNLASDGWLLLRPSGTEPLVRVYAEAASAQRVQQLLDLGVALVKS